MNVYEIKFDQLDMAGGDNKTILAKDMKEAAEIADKMLKIAEANLWDGITVQSIEFVAEVTEFADFKQYMEEKHQEILKNSEEE